MSVAVTLQNCKTSIPPISPKQKKTYEKVNQKMASVGFHPTETLKAVVNMTDKTIVFIFDSNNKALAEEAKIMCFVNKHFQTCLLDNENHLTDSDGHIMLYAKQWKVNDEVVVWNGIARHLEYAHRIATYIAMNAPGLHFKFKDLPKIEPLCTKAFKLSNERNLTGQIPKNFRHSKSLSKGVECILFERINFYIDFYSSQLNNRKQNFSPLQTFYESFLLELNIPTPSPTFN